MEAKRDEAAEQKQPDDFLLRIGGHTGHDEEDDPQ